MRMNVARRLAEGVGSWLHLEFCCYRAGLLSEVSLKAAVGQVLSSVPINTKGARAHSDFPHEAINVFKKTNTKKVDFALVLAGDGVPRRNAQVVVEAKWAGSPHCAPDKIVEDFVRLSLIKRMDPDCACVFVLAGHHRSVEKIVAEVPFKTEGERNYGIGSDSIQKRFNFARPLKLSKASSSESIGLAWKALGYKVPRSIVVDSYPAHPLQTHTGTVDFQARAWNVVRVDAHNL